MPPLLQFRLWLREGPVGERVLMAGVALVFAVLLVLAFLPTAGDNHDGAATVAAAASGASSSGATIAQSGSAEPAIAPGAAATAGPIPAGVSSGAAGATAAAESSAGSAGAAKATAATPGQCAGLTASAPGVTANEVLVDISLVNLAGPVGNTAFNIRPDLHQIADAVVDEINKTGGVACGRKVVIKKYDVNPIDANDQQAKCLQMVQDKPFVVIDNAGYITPVSRSCFVQNKLPFQISTSAATNELTKGYPFLYGQTAPSEKQVRDGALGLAELGFFAPPKFQKLGLMEDACEPEVNHELEANLAKVGVKPAQISKFTLECQLIAPPNEILQGVLQHKAAGATHVFLATSISNSQRYTQLAAQQNFRPVYGTSDYGTNTASVSSWDASFTGGLAISSQHSGDLNSGIRNPEVTACDRILTAHGRKGIATERDDGAGALLCDQLNMFRQAVNRVAANPTRRSFIDVGLSRMGLFKAGVGSDGVFDHLGKVVGGDFHRTLQFDGGCGCWKVRGAPAFKPGF